MGLKTPRPLGGKVWLYLLCICSTIHILTGAVCIGLQILLIVAVSPHHDVSSGLWSGPIFFVEGVIGLIACCDDLACTIVWLLSFTIGGIILAFAVASVAAIDFGTLLRCPKGNAVDAFIPPYCYEPKYSRVFWGDCGQLIAAGLHFLASLAVLYYCCRYIYSKKPRNEASRRSSMAYESVPTNDFMPVKPAISRTSLSGISRASTHVENYPMGIIRHTSV